MSDQFDKNLREHLRHEAEEIHEFPRRLRGRIRQGITPRARSRMAPQLALAGALVLVAFAVLIARNPQVIIKDVPSAIKQILQPSPSPTPQPYICSDRSGGTTGLSAQLTGIRVAHHAESPGFDRIVFDFSGGIPSYDLTRQESSAFVRGASGQSVALDGNDGIKLVFRDADVQGIPDDQKPNLPAVREIAQLGNFERVLTYGVGLSSSGCVRVLELTGPSRLVVDVMTSTSASASPAPTPLPTVPSATDNTPFTCQDLAGGSSPGPAMRLTAVRVAHQAAGDDRIVFEFAAPPGVTPFIPAYTVQRQASAKFIKDPSGQDVTLQGSSGLRIIMHGASGVDSYTGPTDLTPGLPVLKEVERLGDYEAVLSWGAGLSRPSCIRTLELSIPTRLVIDIQTP